MPGGVTKGFLEVLTFTEAGFAQRGTKTWGAGWVFASGGLQRDILKMGEEFDDLYRDGYAPTSSGVANLGTTTTPFKQVVARELVSGSPDGSGSLFLYGSTDVQSGTGNQLYRLTINSGAVAIEAVGSIATPGS